MFAIVESRQSTTADLNELTQENITERNGKKIDEEYLYSK